MDPSALIVAAALSGSLSVVTAAVASAVWTARRLRAAQHDSAAGTPGGWPPSVPRASWQPAPVQQAYRVIVVLDIEQFSRPHWDDHIRVHARRALRQALGQALHSNGIPVHDAEVSDTGDGLLVLIDPAVGTANVLRALLDRLSDGLTVHNRIAVPVAQLRVRVVLHAGHVMLDDKAPVGQQVTYAFRLLDAESLKHRLSRSREPLVVAVSAHVYEQVVSQRPLGLNPDDFEPLPFMVKEISAEAWVHVPGGRIPAGVSYLPFSPDRLPEWVS